MATLFNTKIKDTYQSLLKLEDNTILTTTVKNVTDGLGNASPLYMSTTRIGIGTNAPAHPLDVNGFIQSTRFVHSIDFSTIISGLNFSIYQGGGTVAYNGNSVFSNILHVGTTLSSRFGVRGSGSTSATTSLLVQNSNANQLFSITDDGSTTISLGTHNINGTRLNISTNKVFVGSLSLTSSGAGDTGQAIWSTGGDGQIILAGSLGGFVIKSWASSTITLINTANPRNLFSIQQYGFSDGNTNGLTGNTMNIAPIYNFTGVQASATVRGIYYNPTLTSLVGTTHIALETVTGNVLLGTTSGNVGIGTSNPTNKLEVLGAARISSTLNVGGDSSVGSSYSSGFIAYDTGNGYAHSLIHAQAASLYLFANPQGFAIAGYEPASSGLSASNLAFMTSSSTRMKILSNGNVLIGTTTDAGYKLDVNGSTRVKGNSLTISASGLTSVPAEYVALTFDNAYNHHQNWFAINSRKELGGANNGYDRIIFPTMGGGSLWNFNAFSSSSTIRISSVASTTGNFLDLNDSSISFATYWNVVSLDRTNRKLIFGNMITDVNHLAVYDVVIKGAKPNEGNYGGAASNGGNVYVVGGTPATSPTGNYGNVILAHDGTAIRGNVGIGTNAPTATTHIKGAGSTSATSSLLVQNSAANNTLQVLDDARVVIQGNTSSSGDNFRVNNSSGNYVMKTTNGYTAQFGYFGAGDSVSIMDGSVTSAFRAGLPLISPSWYAGYFTCAGGDVRVGQATNGTNSNPSAILQVNSTVQGFLPPRMTNAQKLAINLPAAGLQVYDTTLNQMSYFNGTTWVNF